MREVIRDIFSGANALFTGKFLASFLMFPVFFASFGAAPQIPLSNIVDESALQDTSEVAISEIKEPDAGNAGSANVSQKPNPIGIVDSAPVTYDLSISGKIATSVTNVGLDSGGAVAVPGANAGYYGASGAHLLVGHNPGIFSGLLSMTAGETVSFRGENYVVTGSRVYDYDPSVGVYNEDGSMNQNGQMMYDSLYVGGSTGLNLMTCYGSYLPNYGTYNQRLVVFAQRV